MSVILNNPPGYETAPSTEEAKDESRMPEFIRRLRRCPQRGIPVPWFVAWENGVPEFRAADGRKLVTAIRQRRCWVCGQPIRGAMTFVLGPMCGVNRVSAEPPCHKDCARWSARNCPFLSRPHMDRRQHDELLSRGTVSAGVPIKRNPGVTLLWTTDSYEIINDNGVLFRVGDPSEVEWWAEGRAATRAEIEHSVMTGLPILEEMARKDGPGAMRELMRLRRELDKYLPVV